MFLAVASTLERGPQFKSGHGQYKKYAKDEKANFEAF